MISDAQLFAATKQLVVPPVQQFLTVDVKSDREQYEPREEGTLWITTKDVDGRPVAAEVALGLIDESVKYIQQDYAGDPRQFYYGSKRALQVQTQSTFQQKSYARLVELQKGQLVDRKDAEDDLPDEPAPALGPEGVDDFENAADDRHDADEDGADHRRHHHVAEDDHAGDDEDDAEKDANPSWRFNACRRCHAHGWLPDSQTTWNLPEPVVLEKARLRWDDERVVKGS
jgi:hypothetical protein